MKPGGPPLPVGMDIEMVVKKMGKTDLKQEAEANTCSKLEPKGQGKERDLHSALLCAKYFK